MIKTLLLCFIHGFKGDEETFFQFPEDLRGLIVDKEPDLKIHIAIYPKYETRGDLGACVEIFKEWLQDQVTDLEQNAATPQAILNPSVGVILIAHSMGGFVAADTLFSVLENRPVSPDPNFKLMFPLIHGVVAFDTPYNGLSNSMFAYGAFSQYQNLSSIWNIGTSVGSLLAGSGGTIASSKMIASHNPSWKRWQLLAARTGTYGAIIAGGVAAYANRAEIAQSLSKVNKQTIAQSWSKVNRENVVKGLSQVPAYVSRESLGDGFTWMASHLKFIGALMKQAQLKTRLDRLSQLKGIGVVDFYTSLGENGYWTGGYFVPKRTFCAIPTKTEGSQIFREQPNTKASDEIAAHCCMFQPDKNVGYGGMAEATRDLVVDWIKNDPRNVTDDYIPSPLQRQRSISEAHLWDDDGKLLGQREMRNEGEDEDELQLQAILDAQDMPEPNDGGISDEELKKAAEVPLPVEEFSEEAMIQLWDGVGDRPKTWKSRIPSQLSGVTMPAMPALPSMPSIRIPGLSKKPCAVAVNNHSLGQETEIVSQRKEYELKENEKSDTDETHEALQSDGPDDIPKGVRSTDSASTKEIGIVVGDETRKRDEISKEQT